MLNLIVLGYQNIFKFKFSKKCHKIVNIKPRLIYCGTTSIATHFFSYTDAFCAVEPVFTP